MSSEVAMEKLSSTDCQRILAVLRRDASLRCREQERIRRLRGATEEDEEEEEEEADRKALALARERRLNARACVRCRRGFPRSGAVLRCGRCGFRICGDCCAQSPGTAPGTCLCITCFREVQLKSGDWFYSQLRKRFGGFGAQPEEGIFLHQNTNKALAEEVDAETAKVREFVERLVEALVSGGLDNVNINRLYSHPEYDCMFSKYHSSLCDAITRLTIALQMSISHHPLSANLDRVGKTGKDGLVAMVGEEDDDGLLCSPSVAHAQLKTLVQQVIDEAKELPRLGIQQFARNVTNRLHTDEDDIDMESHPVVGNDIGAENEDFASKTYEDILATAILNKVILQCQRENEWGSLKGGSGVDRNRNLLVDRVEVGVQAEVEAACRVRGDGCGPEGASAEEYAEEDDEDDNDNANFNSFGRWRKHSQPISYRIEKKVEEVMTTYSSEDEENFSKLKDEDDAIAIDRDCTISSGSSFDDDTSLSMMRGLALHRKRAPFPEFGVDIIDINDDGDNEFSGDEAAYGEELSKNKPTTIVSGVESWEENWLFQRRRLKMRGALSNGGYPMVPMLVPNPSEDLHAQIGDVDAEEISDLSECNDTPEWDLSEGLRRSHHLSSSSASIASDSISSEGLSDPLRSAVPVLIDECPVEAKNHGLIDLAEAQNHQQDSEYTEDYAAAEQRHLAMTPSPIPLEREDESAAPSVRVITPNPVPRPRTQIPSVSRIPCSPQKFIQPCDRRPPPSVSKMEMLQAPESAVIYSGKAAHFILGLWSKYPVDVCWFHEELMLEEDDNHRLFTTSLEVDHPSLQFHLEVFNTDPQNSTGNYTVVVVDSCGNSIWQDFTLTVRGSRRTDFCPEFVVEPTDVTVAEGGEVEMLLEVKGQPEPKVSFWKGASLLHPSPKGYTIERQGGGHWTLHIKKIAPIDGGKLVVEARNRVGVATATAEIEVVQFEPISPPDESVVSNVQEEMRALSSLEESSSVLQNGLQHQAEELHASARRLSQLISQLEDLEIHLHSMEAEFGSLHSDLDIGGIDMTTYITSPWSTPLSSVSSSPPSSLSTSSSQAISALEDSSLEQRKAHLQQLLSCLQKEVEEAEASRDELSECSLKKDTLPSDEKATPPRPGTIAEREHNKWASAPPIPDNPYSPEKISERLRTLNLKRSLGTSRGSGSDTSIDFPEFHSESENSEVAIPKVTINCGGKYLNPKKYGRDYYINSTLDPRRSVGHQNKDRVEGSKQPNRVQQSGVDKQDDDLNDRKKGLLVEAEVARLQKNIDKTEKEWIQNIEITKSQPSLGSGIEEKYDEVPTLIENDEVECVVTEEAPFKRGQYEYDCVNENEANGLQNIASSPDSVPQSNGSMNGNHSSNHVHQNEQVSEYDAISSSKALTDTSEKDKLLPILCTGSSFEPKSLPLQVMEDMPSLPSVRQLALQFSAAAKTEETDSVPVLRRRKVPKDVVIVKKNEGFETRIDPPLQVETDDKNMHDEFDISSHNFGTHTNPGFWNNNHCFASLPLHDSTNALLLDSHLSFQHILEGEHSDENCLLLKNKLENTIFQPPVHSSESYSAFLECGPASNTHSLFLLCGTLVKDNHQSVIWETENNPGGKVTSLHNSLHPYPEDSLLEHFQPSHGLDHIKTTCRNVEAQLSTKNDPQHTPLCVTASDISHKFASTPVNVTEFSCFTCPETVELPLDAGRNMPEQEEPLEGDKHLPCPSPCVPIDRMHNSDEIKLQNEISKCDAVDGDSEKRTCKVSNPLQLQDEGLVHLKELNVVRNQRKYKFKVNESWEENIHPACSIKKKYTSVKPEMTDEDPRGKDDYSKEGTQEGNKNHSVNWEFIRLHIQARLGARTASGKSVLDEDIYEGRRKKTSGTQLNSKKYK